MISCFVGYILFPVEHLPDIWEHCLKIRLQATSATRFVSTEMTCSSTIDFATFEKGIECL